MRSLGRAVEVIESSALLGVFCALFSTLIALGGLVSCSSAHGKHGQTPDAAAGSGNAGAAGTGAAAVGGAAGSAGGAGGTGTAGTSVAMDGGAGTSGGDTGVPGDAGACATACGAHRHCNASTNECICDTGYAGADCSSCASGYQKDASGKVCVSSSCGAPTCTNEAIECQFGREHICGVGSDGCLAWGAWNECNTGGCWCPTAVSGVTAQEWGSSGTDEPYNVAIGLAGDAIVTGSVTGSSMSTQNGMYLSSRQPLLSATADWSSTWSAQSATDRGAGIARDASGALFVAGQTAGAFTLATNLGGLDMTATKWSADGHDVWSTQWGGTSDDQALGIAVSPSGVIYVAGTTNGKLAADNPAPGTTDAVLSKLTSDGKVAWSRQWGGVGTDGAAAVVTDAQDFAYVTGTITDDVFCTKRDSTGAEVWTTTWGNGSSVDSGNAIAIAASGELFVAGFFGGAVPAQSADAGAFVSKLSAAGKILWTRQLGASQYDTAAAVAVGPSGDVYVTGTRRGMFVPGENMGTDDVFVTRIKTDGSVLWTKQIGTTQSEFAYGIAVGPDESVYVTSDTDKGTYPGFVAQGGVDAVLLRIAP